METSTTTFVLLQVLGTITTLPEPFQQRISEQFHTETYTKGQGLLSPDDTSRRIYFVKSGLDLQH